MNRGLWLAAGAGLGIYASFRARRVAEAFTSDGISDRLAALQLGGRLLREDIATAAAEKESELRERITTAAALTSAAQSAQSDQSAHRALPAPDQPQEKERS